MTYYLEHDDGMTRTPCGDPEGYENVNAAKYAAQQHGNLGTVKVLLLVAEVILFPDGKAMAEDTAP